MSIPLDRLYNFIDQMTDYDMVIYHWSPHGSKKLDDFKSIKYYDDFYGRDSVSMLTKPCVICHDQEPTDFDRYSKDDLSMTWVKFLQVDDPQWQISDWTTAYKLSDRLNLQLLTRGSVYPAILLHSEKNSDQIEKYRQQGFVPCYYWSHALIARDWFRYAEHDNTINDKQNISGKDFLIYNRAWSGTREYRLFFTQLLVEENLHESCQTWFSPHDGTHYSQHKYINENFTVHRYDLEKFFKESTASPESSADYCQTDYQSRTIEIVLETLFDDRRNHLTEKALRPMACAHPFMLVGTPRSLEYLRSYGFETFQGLIDESYDTVLDPIERLRAVVKEMRRIKDLQENEKQELYQELFLVAKRNQTRFFSREFSMSVIQELKSNMQKSIEESLMSPDLEGLFQIAEFLKENDLEGAEKLLQSVTFLYNHPNLLQANCSRKNLPDC